MSEENPLLTQVGGTHYTDQELQPIELAYMLGATPAFCKVAKYGSRDKDDYSEQLGKAIHCALLEKALHKYRGLYVTKPIEEAWGLICIFTKIRPLRLGLFHLYYEDYQKAVKQLNLLR